MSKRPYFFVLPADMKSMVDELMADPDPKGERANARALLNMGEVLYQGSVAPFDGVQIVESRFQRPSVFAQFPEAAMRTISGRDGA